MTQTTNTLLFLSCLIVICSFVVSDDGWSYNKTNGPDTWPAKYPKCRGPRQSPVNIIPIQVKYKDMEDLKIQYPNDTALKLSNNGKAIHGDVLSSKSFIVKGAGLYEDFRLKQLYFHVGSQNSNGSEHQIRGKAFPMELHLVHFDMYDINRIVVLSVLFELQNQANPALNGLINKLPNCSYKGDSILIPSFSVKSLLPKDTTQFYRYSGSMTTPQCNDSEWLLFHEKAPISELQLESFRKVYRDSQQTENPAHLVDNVRPVQPLNNRTINRNFDHPQFDCGKKTNTTSECQQTVSGHDVFYTVEVQPCVLPVSFTLEINSPILEFGFSNTLFEDQKIPINIGNLNYGVTTEMHFHAEGPRAGQIHVTIYQAPKSQENNKTKVIDDYFQVEGVCKRANCGVDSWDKHLCATTIGFGSDHLPIGFSSTITDPCGSISMKVKIYRKQTLTGIYDFVDKQFRTVNLTKSIVLEEDKSIVRSRRDVPIETKWAIATLYAHIVKNPDHSVNFMLFYQTTYNGGHYLIFNEKYTYPSGYCKPKPGSNTGRKVAIGVSVVLVMLLILGITGLLLYRNRKAYFGRRPALVDEIDIEDADRL